MGVICRITESVGESGLGVVTLGAMPQIIPLAIAFLLTEEETERLSGLTKVKARRNDKPAT